MIDTDKYEKQLRTTMDYMNSFTKGDWNWSDHVQWSHDELFRPLHETASDLLAEVERLREINSEWHKRIAKLGGILDNYRICDECGDYWDLHDRTDPYYKFCEVMGDDEE